MFELAKVMGDINRLIGTLSDEQKMSVDALLTRSVRAMVTSGFDVPPLLSTIVEHQGPLADKIVAGATRYIAGKGNNGAPPGSEAYTQCPYCTNFHPI